MILPDDVLRLLVSRLLAAPGQHERSAHALRATCSAMRRVVAEAAAERPDLKTASLIALAAHLEGPLRIHLLETTACRTSAQWTSMPMHLGVAMAFNPARLERTLSAAQRAKLVASGVDSLPEVCSTSMDLLLHNVSSAMALLRSAEVLTAGDAHAQAVLAHIVEKQSAKAGTGGRMPHKCVAKELVLAACADLRRRAEALVLSTDTFQETRAKRGWDHDVEHYTHPKSIRVRYM